MNFKYLFCLLYIIYLINIIYGQSPDDDPCSDISLRGPIAKKTSKIFYSYARTSVSGNYSYFLNDPSFKWSSIDVIAVYSSNYDKRISCLAHKNNVRVEFILEEGSFCGSYTTNPNCQYDPTFVNNALIKLGTWLTTYYIDGFSLDFEYSKYGKYGDNNQYANLCQSLRNYLNQMNPNYSITSALAVVPNSNLYNQMQQIASSNDWMVIMAYDYNGYPIGNNMTQLPNVPFYMRDNIKNNYIDFLNNSTLNNKLVVALPLYGYLASCSNQDQDIFTNSCNISSSVTKVNVNTIYEYSQDPNKIFNGANWLPNSRTVYSNYKENGIIYQIVYQTPFSTFSQLYGLGVGGIGVWAIDSLRGLPQPLVEAWYVTFEKDNIRNSFIPNLSPFN